MPLTSANWHQTNTSHHYAILPFTYTNHTCTYVHTKVFPAYHVFTDQLTLAWDRKPATKTETWGSQQRNQDCSLRAGNGKFRTLHILVHLASRSILKTKTCKEVCVRAKRAQLTSNPDLRKQPVRLRPELTHRNEQRVLCVFKQQLSAFASCSAIYYYA
jgi:hypothetical protein